MVVSKRKGRDTLYGGIAVGVASLACSLTALAQATAPQAGTQAGTVATEVVITGSRIRGITASGSNVIAIGQDEIEETPVQSTADLLRSVPQVVTLGANPAGGLAQNGAANVTRSAGINLRGLGNTATLLLFDGRRLPPQGTQAQLTDPSVIPSIALARLEVVADGASAIYGSDAVAGVVNFLPRKDFDGAELSIRSGLADGADYDEQQIAGIAGKTWSSGWAMIAGEYTQSDALQGRDLDWYQRDNRHRGGRDLRTHFCDPGTMTVNGSTYAIPQGGVTADNVDTLVPGTSNLCFYDGHEDVIIPEIERESVLAGFSQDLGNGVRVFGDVFYSHKDGEIPRVATVTANVPSTNPFFVSPVPGANSARVTWSLFPQYESLMNPYYAWSWNASGGVEFDVVGDTRGTFYYSHGESKEVMNRSRNGINSGALASALADTDPATALNVFGGPNNPATIERLVDNLFVITGATELDVANLQFDGSLLELSGGTMRYAVGGEYREEYTFTDLARGNSTSRQNDTDDGSRNVKALFGELHLPLVGPGNSRPGVEELSVSLATRWERYSDFGETTNPKVGITYQPAEPVQLRASYGKSFRAPSFTETSDTGGGAGLYYGTGAGAQGNLSGISIGGGNPDLQPEEATTWSLGAELRPFDGFLASLTWFDIDYKNQIQALTGTPGLLTNPLYAAFRNLNPTPQEIEALRNSGLPIVNPDVLTGDVQYIADTRRQNLGRVRASGIDFTVDYNWDWKGMLLDVGLNGSYFTQYDFEPVPGAGMDAVRNTINFPQKLGIRANLGAAVGKFRSRVTFHHLSGYSNTSVTPAQGVGSYQTVDLFLGYDLTENVTLSAEARNLFDQDPPFVDTTFGYDPQSVNPIPRRLYLAARMRF